MSENPVIGRIANASLVLEHFGYWPNFHDAEVKKVTFEANPGYYPTVTFVLAAFETTASTDERGYFRQAKHCEIELRFTGIKEIDFDGFGHQNVIFSLKFDEQHADLTCTLDSAVGLDAFIVAQAAEVVSLLPNKMSDHAPSA
ncbi:Imm50 family immunity protein [Hymenobacter endophyticus]|uniref:Imm50 family immunity protein n=1 Tax=Hymenobacter endophyticus TaxID=3076335 RepID=A0ABU3TFG4_9BACT|nr:Imm50 family immunity protein [Hymenobacter endophyticus]MDU0370104.1 Imm50 family immunity protein [Hymenobacter endophyticus]